MTQPSPHNPKPGLAKAALIMGIVSIVSAFIPYVNNLAWAVGLVGIVVAAIALMNSEHKKMAVVGLMLSLFSGGIGLFMASVYAVLFVRAATGA